MWMKLSLGKVFVFVLGVTFFCVKNGHAYLDPGSGSYVFQMIIAGFVGAIFAIKMSWDKIKVYLKNFFARQR